MFFVIFISGLVGMAAQVIGLRQLTAVFQGNELTMGILFAAWLCWTALGGWIGSRATRGGIRILGIAIAIQAIFLPITVWLIRSTRGLMGIQPGQIVGLFPILVSALITLLPVALLTGLCFSLGCHAWKSVHNSRSSSGAVGVQQVYIAESIGAAVGGLASFFLAPILEPFLWAFLIAAVGVGAGIWTITVVSPIGRWIWGIMVIIGVLLAHFLGANLEKTTLVPLFAGQEIIAKEESPYGQLVATQIAEQTTLYINGIKEANVPDPFTAEEVAHIALAVHPNPQNIVLIGGIVGETPHEILKHPTISQLDLVELDPELIRMAENLFPDSMSKLLENPKVSIIAMDGRRMMSINDRSYDAILMNLPDPLNAQVNRFYTVEWFQEVRKHLLDNGIFSFSVHSSENVMNREQARFLACIYRTLQSVIPYVKVLPGANAHFLASPDSSVLQFNAESVLATLEARGMETVYISSAYLPHILQAYRMEQLEERILEQQVPINQDFVPVGYYTGLVLWDTHFKTSLRSVFVWLRKLPFGYSLIIIGIAALILLGISFYQKSGGKSPLPVAIRTAIFTVGAAEIGMEILMILGFQIVFGVAYGWVAVLVTAFMVGLAMGARIIPVARVKLSWFIIIQICVVLVPLVMWFLVVHSQGLSGYHPAIGALIFGLGALVAGTLGGAQFPIATALIINHKQNTPARVGGGLYALDLLGSSLGAIILSTFIVPLWGLGSAFVILSFLNFIPLIILRK